MRRYIGLLLLCLALLAAPVAGAREASVFPYDLLYYNEKGGVFFHVDSECEIVHPNFLPMAAFAPDFLPMKPFSLLAPCETCVTADLSAFITAAQAAGLLNRVYYNPNGGSFYHTDANCSYVNAQYLPLTPLTNDAAGTAAFARLSPCAGCVGEAAGLPQTSQGANLWNDQSETLYHNPRGGSHYHTDISCLSVSAEYLPLTPFARSALSTSPYNRLTPCAICGGAQPRATATQTLDADLVYYNPNGGSYYHAAEICQSVGTEYLPLRPLMRGALSTAQNSMLRPCPICLGAGNAATASTVASPSTVASSPVVAAPPVAAAPPVVAAPSAAGTAYAATGSSSSLYASLPQTLYRVPGTGRFYHASYACSAVAPAVLPMQPFLKESLQDAGYRDLAPCPACVLPDGA